MSDVKLSRRGFFKGAGLAAGAAALLDGSAQADEAGAKTLGPGAVEATLLINGEEKRVRVEPRATLASVLRDDLGLTGTKIGCDRGACGACTVMLGGQPVPACSTFALDAVGVPVTTIEGLAKGDQLAPIQAAFVAHDALQCGFCTPGMVMSCHALLLSNPHPDAAAVRQAVAGNTCRCGTYPKVFEAALAAASGAAAAAPGPAAPKGPSATVAEATGKRTFQVGIAGALAAKERVVAAGEPQPWDGSAKLAVVGTGVPRLEGAEKVTGRARYAFDVRLPGMLYAAVVRSPHPHAEIEAVDTAAAEAMPGVKAAYVLERILGPATLKVKPPVPAKYPRVRFAGQPIAAVAALTQAQADDAARAVLVRYKLLRHVSDIDAAREKDAPLVFEGMVEQAATAGGGGAAKDVPQAGNVRGPVVSERGGDVEEALKGSAATVAETYRTEVQTHSPIEPHGVVADWGEEGVTIHASTQGLHSVQDEIAALFDLPKSKVHVKSDFTGGGFGAKFGAGNYGVVALHLSRAAKRPVRLFFDRRMEHLAAGNRPSSVQHLRLGAAKDGELLALDLEAFGSAGCAAGAGCAGPAKNLYPAKVVRTRESDVFLHTGPAAAFRAPGHPQGAFALESALDELANKLKLDPVALRDRNDAHPARREERRLGAAKFGWAALRARKDSGKVRRGVGFAQGLWYNFDGPLSSAEVIVHDDGSVECRSAVADIGGGIRTAIAQVVAEVFGLRPAEVKVRVGDTEFPQGPPSGGSMTTQLLTPAVRLAAERAKAQWTKGKTVRGFAERAKDYGEWNDGDRFTATIGGAQFVEVEVDTETGIVRVLRVVAAHDCGRPVNRLAIESQINGGIIQGVSFALHEQRVMDHATGRMLNSDLEHYRIAGSQDVPRIEPILVEHFLGRSNTDVSGIGEPATVPTSAAIANAVAHALGVRLRSLPITPARVLAALKGAKS